MGGLIITGNPLVPTGALLNFSSAAAVGTYFGTSSEEYARAVFYFGWISKNITAPNQLSFWNWNNDAATDSLIFGEPGSYSASTFTPITTGDLTLTMAGLTEHVSGISFGSDSTLAQVAATMQTKIRAANSAWASALVTFNATTGQFNLDSGVPGVDTISITAGTTTDVASLLGWLTGAVFSNGTAAQTISTSLNNLINLTNNFGSFCFTTALAPVLATIEAAATWNDSLTPNNQFMFSVSVTAANAAAWYAALKNIGGCAATLVSPQAGSYSEMEPMMILAATQYAEPARNSVQDFMYQVFNDTASVTDGTHQALYDGMLINYYGNTQQAGQVLSFYQRGVMFGIATNPQDMGVYCNEIWLKGALFTAIMTLLLSQAEVPANTTGAAQLTATCQSVINQALQNGTISVGKTLTTEQQLYITQATGSANAWQQVQAQGYWFNVVIEPVVKDGITEYEAIYTLIYSKNDVIRTVIGTDILI